VGERIEPGRIARGDVRGDLALVCEDCELFPSRVYPLNSPRRLYRATLEQHGIADGGPETGGQARDSSSRALFHSLKEWPFALNSVIPKLLDIGDAGRFLELTLTTPPPQFVFKDVYFLCMYRVATHKKDIEDIARLYDDHDFSWNACLLLSLLPVGGDMKLPKFGVGVCLSSDLEELITIGMGMETDYGLGVV
jgi:hypothetical protein